MNRFVKSTISTATKPTIGFATCDCLVNSPTRNGTPENLKDCDLKCVVCGKNCGRPSAIDLFCGAGGAAYGLRLAGFCVCGVDIKRQPRYAGCRFIQGDALQADLSGFDFVWASPPCQRYTRAQNASKNRAAHPDLIASVRDKLGRWGGPWIMENVVGAPLINPTTLCGLAFGLMVKRHRLFESNIMLLAPPCPSHDQDYYVIFGHECRNRVRMGEDPKGTRCGRRNNIEVGRKAMGIDWMNRAELSEAIPPVYSEFLGRQVLGWGQQSNE